MVIKIIMTEVHGEILNSTNSLKLQNVIKSSNFSIHFLKGKIDAKVLRNYHVLIIGGPTVPLDLSEILAVEKFVNQGGFLVLLSVAGGDLSNNNLSELSRRFEFEFNPDYVEDYKHNINNNPRLPIIRYIKKGFSITKSVNKIVFTGCSISVLDDSVKGFLYTDKDALPYMATLGVVSLEKNIIGLSSSSIFNDTLLDKFDNKRLLQNILNYIESIFKKIEKELRVKHKNLTPLRASKIIEHLIMLNSKKLEEIDKLIDKMWSRIIDQIPRLENKIILENLEKSYKLILQKIDLLDFEVGQKNSEFNFLGEKYQESVQQAMNRWYEIEAEKREKLDMIKNNLLTRINNSN